MRHDVARIASAPGHKAYPYKVEPYTRIGGCRAKMPVREMPEMGTKRRRDRCDDDVRVSRDEPCDEHWARAPVFTVLVQSCAVHSFHETTYHLVALLSLCHLSRQTQSFVVCVIKYYF